MANWTILKEAIANVINANDNQEITGQRLQDILHTIVTSVGENATFIGIATVGTQPGVPDGYVFYLASEPGTYTNFGSIKVKSLEIAFLKWNGSSWGKHSIDIEDTIENSLTPRLRGTSNLSNSRFDPFKLLGYESYANKDKGYDSYEAFNSALDSLLYDTSVTGYNYGYFRARVMWRDVEIKNILLSSGQQNIIQVVSGTLNMRDNAVIADDWNYRILWRQHANSTGWSTWKEYGGTSSGDGGEVSPELEAQVNENTVNIAQNASDIKKLMDKEFPISVTLSVSNSVQNILTPNGNYTFSWSIKKGNDKVTPSSISLIVNGKAITSVTTNDTSYTYKYNSGGNVSPKLEANLVVTIEGNPHKASTSVTFVYPSYIGVVNNTFDINSADAVDRIKSLEQLIYSSKGCTYEVPVATAPQRVVYAYPKSFRALTSIKDANNLDMLNDFESSAHYVYANTEYYVYILRDATMNKGTVTLKFS